MGAPEGQGVLVAFESCEERVPTQKAKSMRIRKGELVAFESCEDRVPTQ